MCFFGEILQKSLTLYNNGVIILVVGRVRSAEKHKEKRRNLTTKERDAKRRKGGFMSEREKIQLEILQKKLNLINKKYQYTLTIEKTGNSILPYTIKTRTEKGYIVQSRSFESLEQLYFYIQGMMYILEI